MAMSGTALGDAIVSAIESVPEPSPADGGSTYKKAYWEAIGTAIVSYLQANATVSPNALSGASLNNSGGPVAGSGSLQ